MLAALSTSGSLNWLLLLFHFHVPSLSEVLEWSGGEESFSFVADQTWLCRHFFATWFSLACLRFSLSRR